MSQLRTKITGHKVAGRPFTRSWRDESGQWVGETTQTRVNGKVSYALLTRRGNALDPVTNIRDAISRMEVAP